MEALLRSFLRKYFAVFLRNFDARRDFHFNLSRGEVTVSNLDVNVDVVREAIGVETLDVCRLRVSNCLVNVTPTKLTGVPITIDIDEVDIVLAELESPRPLPDILQKLALQPAAGNGKAGAYGMKEKLADGLRVRIKAVTIILQTLGGATVSSEYISQSKPPLLLLAVDNFLLEQTDDRWRVVPLPTARTFSDGKPDVWVFRQLQCKVSVMLIPCESKDDPAWALLSGAKLSSFAGKGGRNTLMDGGGRLGAAVLLDRMPVVLRLMTQWSRQQQQITAVQIDLQLGVIKIQLSENRIGLVLEFLAGLMHMLSRRALKSDKLEATRAVAEKANIRFRQLMPSAPKKTVVHVPRFGRQQTRAAPKLVLRFALQELSLGVVLTNADGAPPPLRELGVELGNLHVAFVHEETVPPGSNAVHHLYLVQANLFWIDVYSIGAREHDSFKLLVYPSDTSPILSPMEEPRLSIHPHAEDEEELENVQRARMRRFVPVLAVLLKHRSPCPALPEYGTDLQVRLRRLDVIVYEETILALLFLEQRLKLRAQTLAEQLGALSPAPSSAAVSRTPSVAQLQLPQPPAPQPEQASHAPPAESSPYKVASSWHGGRCPFMCRAQTVHCTLDLNGPSMYYVPNGLVRPMLRIKLNKIVVLGNASLPEPRLGPRCLCRSEPAPSFPEKSTDFTCLPAHEGKGLAFTKLEASVQNISVAFLGSRDTVATPVPEDIELERVAGQSDFDAMSPTQGRSRSTSVRADPTQDESPILHLPEITVGISWDDTALPQFQASVSIPLVRLSFSRSLLNLSAILASTTLGTFRQLKLSKQLRLNSLLLMIPQPFVMNEEQFNATVNASTDPLALLPSYAVGLHVNKVNVTAYDNGAEVLQLYIVDTAGVLEHHFDAHKATDGHHMFLKFSLGDLQISSLSPTTLSLERLLYSRQDDVARQPLVAGRLEHTLSNRAIAEPSAATEAPGVPSENGDEPSTSIFFRQLARNQKIMGKLSSLLHRYRKFRKHEIVLRVGLLELLSSIHALDAIATLFLVEEDMALYSAALDEYQSGLWRPWEAMAVALANERLSRTSGATSGPPPSHTARLSTTPTATSSTRRPETPSASRPELASDSVAAALNRLTAMSHFAETALLSLETQLAGPALMQSALQQLRSSSASPGADDVGAGLSGSSASLLRDWRAVALEDDRMSVAESETMTDPDDGGSSGAAAASAPGASEDAFELADVEAQLSQMADALSEGNWRLSTAQVQAAAKEVMLLLSSPGSSQSALLQRLLGLVPQPGTATAPGGDDDLFGEYVASVAAELWSKRPLSARTTSSLTALVDDLPPLVVHAAPSGSTPATPSPQPATAPVTFAAATPVSAAASSSSFKSRMQTFATKLKDKSREVVSKGTQIVTEKINEVREKTAAQRSQRTSVNYAKLQAYVTSLAEREAAMRAKVVADVRDALRQLQAGRKQVDEACAAMETRDQQLLEALSERQASSVQAAALRQELDSLAETARRSSAAQLESERRASAAASIEQLLQAQVQDKEQRIHHLEEQLKIYEQQLEHLVHALNRTPSL